MKINSSFYVRDFNVEQFRVFSLFYLVLVLQYSGQLSPLSLSLYVETRNVKQDFSSARMIMKSCRHEANPWVLRRLSWYLHVISQARCSVGIVANSLPLRGITLQVSLMATYQAFGNWHGVAAMIEGRVSASKIRCHGEMHQHLGSTCHL